MAAPVSKVSRTFKIQGVKEVRDEMRAIALRRRKGAARGLYRIANRIMRRSKSEFVPVDDGPLRASGRVLLPVWEGDTLTIALVYGDAATPYALAVHEHLSQHSPPSWQAAARNPDPNKQTRTGGRNRGRFIRGGTVVEGVMFGPYGRGPKYLEKPVLEAAGTLLADLRAELE